MREHNLQLLFGQLGNRAPACARYAAAATSVTATPWGSTKVAQSAVDSLGAPLNFTANRALGHNTVEAIEAMLRGEVKRIAPGSNLAAAAPDTERTARAPAQRGDGTYQHQAFNRSHLRPAKTR
ncbi:hypothetical protein M8494_09025 [Serratia ureilytica]